MNSLKSIILLAGCLMLIEMGLAAPQYNAGETDLTISDSQNQRPLNGWLWYPTTASKEETTIAGNPVWADIPGQSNAPIAVGQHPLILLSHGMYGNIYNQGWLARSLSQRGYLVAAINHPGTSTRSRDPQQAQQLWERTRDLSRIVDYLLEDAEISQHLDPNKIAAAGHSLGGYTVMRLLGAIHDDERHDTSCAPNPKRPDCRAMQTFNIGNSEQNIADLKQPLTDSRIKAVITLDLGGTQAFSPESLANVKHPVLVIGAGRNLQLDQTVESQALAERLPVNSSRYLVLQDGGHFDFMGICTERGEQILKESDPEGAMVCEDGTGSRAIKHEFLVDEITAFLKSFEAP